MSSEDFDKIERAIDTGKDVSTDEGNGASYPHPDEVMRNKLDGQLADRVCRAFGEPEGTPVFIEETKQYGGYSEYTQENAYYHKLFCGEQSREFNNYDSKYSNLNALIEWLDRNAPIQP